MSETSNAPEAPATKVFLALGKNWDHKRIKDRTDDAMSARPIFNRHDRHVTLSPESKMTAHAVAQLFLNEKERDPSSDAVILCSGGPTGKAPGWPSEAAAMRRYILEQHPFGGPRRPRIELDHPRGEERPGIGPESVMTEGESPDTWANAKKVQELLGKFHKVCLTICTVGFHAPRAETIFKRSGYEQFDMRHSEDVIRQRDPHYAALVDAFQKSWRWKTERALEVLFRGILTIDSKGRIPQFTAKLARMRNTDKSSKAA